jgi:cytochrome c oxidase assembly factor CtaG
VTAAVDFSWSLSPIILLALAGYLAVYVLRWRTARREGGPRAAPTGALALWIFGIGCLFAALISPLDRLGEQFASFHMIQHLLIADLAAIALTLALTRHILRPVTRRIRAIEQRAGPFAHPAFGAIAYVGVMWFWHVPAFYDATLTNELVHSFEHLSFAAAGLLYWWHLLSPIRSRLRGGGIGILLYMGVTKVLVGFLGIVLAFAPSLLYDAYERDGRLLGMTALDDQQVAGLLMGLEQSIIMGIALAFLFVRMLSEADAADYRQDRYPAPRPRP